MIIFLIVIAFIAAAFFLGAELRNWSDSIFGVLALWLSHLERGLETARVRCASYWAEHLGPDFRIRAFLGGLFSSAMLVLLVFADYHLVRMTVESIFTGMTTPRSNTTFVQSLLANPAVSTSVLLVGAGAILGHALAEWLGFTNFFGWRAMHPTHARYWVASLAFFLLLVCTITGGIAAYRTAKSLDVSQQEDQFKHALDDKVPEMRSQVPSLSPRTSLLDSLMVVGMGILGFMIPLLAALVAHGIYPLVMFPIALGYAVFIFFPLIFATWIARQAMAVVGSLASFVRTCIDLFARPGELLAPFTGVARPTSAIAATPSPDAPPESMPGGMPPGSDGRRADVASEVNPEPDTVVDEAVLAAKLSENPLDINPDEMREALSEMGSGEDR